VAEYSYSHSSESFVDSPGGKSIDNDRDNNSEAWEVVVPRDAITAFDCGKNIFVGTLNLVLESQFLNYLNFASLGFKSLAQMTVSLGNI
jgi:hypothetical protein